jgi:hypothetical protein
LEDGLPHRGGAGVGHVVGYDGQDAHGDNVALLVGQAAVLQLLAAIGIVCLVARLLRAQYLLSGQPFSIGGFYRALLGRTV